MCARVGLGLRWSVLYNLLSDLVEHFVNIASSLGGCLKELESVLGRKTLSALGRYDSVGQVRFVCYQNLRHSTACVRLNLPQPVRNVVKGSLLGAVVNKDDAHGALVIGLRDGSEAFLARSVPHLQLHALVTHQDRLDLEVDACKTKLISYCCQTSHSS